MFRRLSLIIVPILIVSLPAWLFAQPADKEITVDLGNNVKLKMVRVPKGKAYLGWGDNQCRTRQEDVAEFYLGAYEVTQAQWKAVMGADNNPSYFKGDDLPVERVSWDDAKKFIGKINEKTKKSGYLYRLPTSVEWEYACRGGPISEEDSKFDFYFDKPTNDLSSDGANFNGNFPAGGAGKSKYLERTVKVGSYKPNKLGLYDMHGNVSEWTDSMDRPVSANRVTRGGSYDTDGLSCKAGYWHWAGTWHAFGFLGFRLAAVPRTTPEPAGGRKDVAKNDKELTVDLGNGVKLKMAQVPKGKAYLGGWDGKAGTKQTDVAEFYLGVYEVTQAQWQAVMGADNNPSQFQSDDLPVEKVSYNDAKKFIEKLNEKSKGGRYSYRLPTPVEWEYACRGGPISEDESKFSFYFDKPTNDLSAGDANFDWAFPAGKGTKGKAPNKPVKVGSYKPNKLGLYDMYGNVWEWTDDRYCGIQEARGGSWISSAIFCAAPNVDGYAREPSSEYIGFRLAAGPSK